MVSFRDLETALRHGLSNPTTQQLRLLAVLAALVSVYGLNSTLNARSLSNLSKARTWNWRKEIILITGGSSRIGELVVRRLAKRGIRVVVLDVVEPSTPFPSNVYFFKADITSPDAVRDVAAAIRQDVGEPTVLINNAGIATMRTILDQTNTETQRTFEMNAISLFTLAREFLPHMIKHDHGHIITVASMASFFTCAANVDYSCTKAAALAFHEGLTQELRHRYNAPHVRTRHGVTSHGIFGCIAG
ncbi:hypothetical protein LRP88_00265 [Fusarium phalaenopsidis]